MRRAGIPIRTVVSQRGLPEGLRKRTRRWRRRPLSLPTSAYPLRHYLDRDDQQCARQLVVPLQVDVIAWSQVSPVHKFLGHRDLAVACDLTRAMRHVHTKKTTNICSMRARASQALRMVGGA